MKHRYTIGVLVGGIGDDFSKDICKGVFQQARVLDANVVVFPGKYLERDLSEYHDWIYEYQYNMIFSFAKKENVDALIISMGSIGAFTTEDRIKVMLEQYNGIPCILVASKIDGYTSVVYDNCHGIKEAMKYLIEKKGCTKFAMLAGPKENSDSRERKQTFMDVLKEYNLPCKDTMFQEGDLSRRCQAACARLLDANPDVQAIVCVNDESAVGLYEELHLREMQAGRDIVILGYDDSAISMKMHPPLSTIRADSSKLGQEALRLAMKILNGETVNQYSVLPTRFMKRDSFGGNGRQIGDEISIEFDSSFNDIFYHAQHEKMSEKLDGLYESYIKLLETVMNESGTEEENSNDNSSIMRALEAFIHHGGVKYADMHILFNVLETLYQVKCTSIKDDGEKLRLRDIFSQIYIEINHAQTAEIGNIQEEKMKDNDAIRAFVQKMLQFEKEGECSYKRLLENLDWLNLQNAAIYMLPKPTKHLFKEPYEAPEYMLLKAVLKNGIAHTIPLEQQKQEISHLFYSDSKKGEKRYERALLPLFFNEMLYGVFLCDMTKKLYNNGEFLVNQLSSAVKMIALLEENEKIRQQLEDNMNMLRNHNIELDSISKTDPLTGLFNRRGFFSEAEKLYLKCCSSKEQVLVVYVDMNNLKMINDRYGHEEGDFSLKLIGECLKELVRETGCAGRIGGDEYACVLHYKGNGDGTDIIERLYHWFERFNNTSSKDYLVTISAGICLVRSSEDMTLDRAIRQADENLYSQKQVRKKEIVKKNL